MKKGIAFVAVLLFILVAALPSSEAKIVYPNEWFEWFAHFGALYLGGYLGIKIIDDLFG